MTTRHLPGNADLTYFTVTCHLAPIIADLSQDSDYDPNTTRIDAVVTFTPKLRSGEVIHAHGATPPTGFLPLPVQAIIDDGYLKLRSKPDLGAAPLPGNLHGLKARLAADGNTTIVDDAVTADVRALNYAPVRLLGNSPALELEPDYPLYYDFTFSNIKIDNKATNYTITGGTFEAPWEDTVIDLLDWMPLTPGPYAQPMVVGPQGPQGIPGPVTANVGTTTTSLPGSDAAVSNSGDDQNMVLDFVIPRGEPGPPGPVPAGVEFTANKGVAGGYTPLGADGKVPSSHLLPLFVDVAAAPYNVTPTTANPEVKIQEAIDFAAANGIPEVIISRPGTYTVGLRQIPGQTSVAAAFWGRSNLKLTMKPGVVIKLMDQATLPAGSTQGHIISVIKPFTFSVADAKTGWSVEGGVIDGNAANQSGVGNTPNGVTCGLFLGACRSSVVRGVKIINIWGNNTVPPGETFFFEANSCRDVTFVNCEADGSGSVNTATGFSSNNSFGVSWTGCVSHDMGVAMGFTAWQCSGLRYTNCHAYKNGAHGFNSERNDDVVFTSCVAGGSSPLIGYGNNTNPWFQAAQQRMGNVGAGFAIHGCENVSLGGCVSTYNGFGLRVYTNQLSPLKICKQVTATGCVFKHSSSGVNNVYVESAAEAGKLDQFEVHITDCLASNGLPEAIYNYSSEAPQFRYETKAGVSGVRYWTTGTGGWSYRWNFGTNAGPLSTGASLALNTTHQLLTAGRRLNTKSVTAEYVVQPMDEVIAADTTAGEFAVQLAAASSYGAGATLLIKDVGGKAGESGKRITINAFTGQFIEGVGFKRITTNYGQLRLMCTGTGWVIIDTPEAVSPAIAAPAIWPAANGLTPTITAGGTATDHNLNLTGKGAAGVVQAGGTQVEVKGHTHTVAQVTGAAQWVAVPASATATGTPGQLAADATHLYVCYATNAWKTIAHDLTWKA